MVEVDRLDVIISADGSKAIAELNKTSSAVDKLNSDIAKAGNAQFGSKISTEASKAKGALSSLSGEVDPLSAKLKNIDMGKTFSTVSSASGNAATARSMLASRSRCSIGCGERLV